MTTTTTRSVTGDTTLPSVPVAGVRGDYTLTVHPAGSPQSVSCPEREVSVILGPEAREQVAGYLLEAADLLTAGARPTRALETIGSVVGTLPDRSEHRFEVEVVRAPGTDVVLLTCEPLGVDGLLTASAARRLGELLRHT